MAIKILEIKKENCPATRFIGKKYDKALIGVNGGKMIGFQS